MMTAEIVKHLAIALAVGASSLVGMSATDAQESDQKAQDRQQRQEQKQAEKSRQQQEKELRRQDKQEQKALDHQHRQQQRLSEQQQKQRIEAHEKRLKQYRGYLKEQERAAEQYVKELDRQNRREHQRFQQRYLARLREQERYIDNIRNYDYDDDPYFYTAPSYRYSRGGRFYETNQYGADLLRQAVNYGYEEGYRAALADRKDNWRSSYQDSYAYRDANYGYRGYYVDRDDYNYFFREGFRRGYDDGYANRYQYGTYSGGTYSILDTVLAGILGLQQLQ
jgi:hypothetical protein